MSLPITLHVENRQVLVAGGGKVALRKASALANAGARVRVVAPSIMPELQEFVKERAGELELRGFQPSDLDGVFLAVAATNDETVNAALVREARERGVLVCDATAADRGDFALPAVVRVGELTFTIETGGAAPAFSKRIAEELRERFGAEYGAAVRSLRRMRAEVKRTIPKVQRPAVLRDLASLPVEVLAGTRVPVVCATRGSTLAMIQARTIATRVAERGIATTFLTVATTGDRLRDRSFNALGAQGVFVKELETALREERARYAVHSCKDLPSELPSDMRIAAVSAREDPRDVFCSERFANFAALPANARVATSSLRRRAQLASLRSDLQYVDIRGNVDSRLRKLRDGECDALVLAAAGMTRLGATARYADPFDVSVIVPATGQGALAIETLASEEALANELRAAVNDEAAERAVLCERAALRALQGGCQTPIGIFAGFMNGELRASGTVAAVDGSRRVHREVSARVAGIAEAEALGRALAHRLLENGAGALLPNRAQLPLSGKIVVLPRTQERPSRIAAALRADGAEVIEMRSGDEESCSLGERVPDMIVFASSGSVAAAQRYLRRARSYGHRPAIAAMGPATSAAASAAGFVPDVVAEEAAAEALVSAVRAHLAAVE